nr:PREDICTED: trichohyalin-like [Stegastes partitus]
MYDRVFNKITPFVKVQRADYRIGQLEALLDKSQRKCKELEETKRQNIADSHQKEEVMMDDEGDVMDDRDELTEQLREKDKEILRLSELLQEDGKLQREKNNRLKEENQKLQEENQKLKLKVEMEVKATATNRRLVERNRRLQEEKDGLEEQKERLQMTNKELLEENKTLLSETVMENRWKRLKVEKEQLDCHKDEEVQRLKQLNDSLVSNIQKQLLDKETQHQHREEDWRSQLRALDKL